MALSIKYLQDNKSGKKALFYPITHERAIQDTEGISLETKFETINNRTDGLNSAVEDQGRDIQSLQAQVNELITGVIELTELPGFALSISGRQISVNWSWID